MSTRHTISPEELSEHEIKLDGKSAFKIYTNMSEVEVRKAVMDWMVKTVKAENLDSSSLCQFVNAKRLKGASVNFAFTKSQFKKLKENI